MDPAARVSLAKTPGAPGLGAFGSLDPPRLVGLCGVHYPLFVMSPTTCYSLAVAQKERFHLFDPL